MVKAVILIRCGELGSWRLKSRLGACGHETRLRGLGPDRTQSAEADFVAAAAARRRGFNRPLPD